MVRYLRFLSRSSNRYGVHSPFIYSLIDEVLRSREKVPGSKDILRLRRRMLADSGIIMKTDYGTAAGVQNCCHYPVSVKRMARRSLASLRRARQLYHLALYMKAENIIELGTSLGITSAFLASAVPSGKLITIEGCPETAALAEKNLSQLGKENAMVLTGRFEEMLPVALDRIAKPDMVYIDGNHRREATMEYFNRVARRAHNDTVVVIDDIHASDGMEKAWQFIREHPSVTVTIDLYQVGMVFFRKELATQHFVLRY